MAKKASAEPITYKYPEVQLLSDLRDSFGEIKFANPLLNVLVGQFKDALKAMDKSEEARDKIRHCLDFIKENWNS